MFTVTQYTVDKIKDPFKILVGDRYEFLMELEVDEEDELYQEEGVSLRVIYAVEENKSSVLKYEFFVGGSGKYLDFNMEDEELVMIETFCAEHME